MAVKWEDNILGFIPPKDWLDVDFEVTRPNDPVDTLFGDQKTDNLVAEWESLAAEYQIPVMAHFHGFDTEANTTFRVPVDNHNIEKGLIKVKINQSERLRALLRSGVTNDDRIYEYVTNDGLRLAEQVITRTKVAKNELMATGQVTIKENDLDLTVDYGVPAANKAHTIDTSVNNDVLADIQTIIDAAQAKGVIITGMMTSSAIIGKLRKNAALQKAINGNIGAGAMVRKSALEEFLSEEFGINQILTNDLTYGKSAVLGANGRPVITSARYYPQNKITFYGVNAAGRLGVGLWGDAPEVDIANLAQVEQSGESPFISIMQWTEKDPTVLWTKASTLFMPVLFNPDSLFIATDEGA